MKIKSMIPKFLQSEILCNQIIRTKKIESIRYESEMEFEIKDENKKVSIIKFFLLEGKIINWVFSTKEQGEKEYRSILNQLKDRKIVIESSNKNKEPKL